MVIAAETTITPNNYNFSTINQLQYYFLTRARVPHCTEKLAGMLPEKELKSQRMFSEGISPDVKGLESKELERDRISCPFQSHQSRSHSPGQLSFLAAFLVQPTWFVLKHFTLFGPNKSIHWKGFHWNTLSLHMCRIQDMVLCQKAQMPPEIGCDI